MRERCSSQCPLGRLRGGEGVRLSSQSPAPRPEPLGPGLLPRLAGLSLSSLWGHLPDNTPHSRHIRGVTHCWRTSAKGFCGGEDGCSVGRLEQRVFSPRVTNIAPKVPISGQRTRKTSYSWIGPAKSRYWKRVSSTLLS